MADITFRSDFTTDIVDQMGDDDSVLRAMLISTLKDATVDDMMYGGKRGRINFLMSGRHGTPFEHNSMTFRSEAPIFVYREWHRHRIGVSINEQSGRYVELPPMFYVPPMDRPLVQVGKPGAYEYVPGDEAQHRTVQRQFKHVCTTAYEHYQGMLNSGIAREVARMVLPVNIYSSMYWTCNARSLMAFLSLRTRSEPFWVESEYQNPEAPCTYWQQKPGGAAFPSKPMWEIEACARAMEQVFHQSFPLTHEAFVAHGRVAP